MNGNPILRDVNRALAEASDPTILRIVAAVDAVADRGSADDLIVPIRPRLATLQPPRRLRFVRLLFHPLSPLIVPTSRWRPASPMFPRTAVAPMAHGVHAALGRTGAAIEAEIASGTMADLDTVRDLGRHLWPAAARILGDLRPPAGWRDTGLGEPHFRDLARSAAAVLARAPALDDVCADTANGLLPPRAEAIRAILRGIADDTAIAMPMVIVLLLTRLPEAAQILMRGNAKSSAVVAALDQAEELVLDQLETDGPGQRIASGTLAAASAAVRQLYALLAHLALDTGRPGDTGKPGRMARISRIRSLLDAACRSRFQAALENDLLRRLHDPMTTAVPRSIATLEATARGLRTLETEARSIGGGRTYDTMLAQAAAMLRSPQMRARFPLADRARLVEILEGPDAALAMIHTER